MSTRAQRLIALQGAPLDSDAVAWAAAVRAKGGTVSRGKLASTSRVIRSLKVRGVWPKIADVLDYKVENAEQATTSWKQRLAGTMVGSPAPALVPGRFMVTDGSQSRVRTGYIPLTHGAGITANANEGITVYEHTDVGSNGGHGAYKDANGALYVLPGNGVSTSGQVNSNGFTRTSATAAKSRGATTVLRTGTTYKIYKNGVLESAPSGPSFTGNSQSSVELLAGAYNNNGTAAGFRPSALGMMVVHSGDLTDADVAALHEVITAYQTDILPMDVYLSSVSYGGIGIGSDSSGVGLSTLPFLTIDHSYTNALPGDRLVYNGDPGSPSVYTASTKYTDDKAIRHKALVPWGATLAASGVTAQRRVGPLNGELVEYDGFLFDGPAQTSGPAQNLLYLLSKAIKYPVVATRCKFRDWDDYNAINQAEADLKVDLKVLDSIFTNSAARSAIAATDVVEGSLLVRGGSTTITNGLGAASGPIVWKATAAGVTATIEDHDLDYAFDAAISGIGLIGYLLNNTIGARIANLDVVIDASAAPTKNCHAVAISQDRSSPFPIDDSVIHNVNVQSNAAGGSLCRVGDDDADRTYANRVGIQYGTGVGSPNFAANAGHNDFMVNVTDGWIRYRNLSAGGIGLVNKRTLRADIGYNVVSDMTSSISLHKSAEDFEDHHGVYTLIAGNDGATCIYAHADEVTLVPSYGSVHHHTCTIDGAENAYFIRTADGSTLTFANGVYNVLSGSAHATPFVLNGVSYTPAQWKALVEPTATGNIF